MTTSLQGNPNTVNGTIPRGWDLLLVSPKAGAKGLVRKCPVCDHVPISRGKHCGECGSKVA